MPICTVRIGACISPARPASAGAQAEHQREQQLDVDAKRADHFAVRGAGADQHADAGPHHDDIKSAATASATTMIDNR